VALNIDAFWKDQACLGRQEKASCDVTEKTYAVAGVAGAIRLARHDDQKQLSATYLPVYVLLACAIQPREPKSTIRFRQSINQSTTRDSHKFWSNGEQHLQAIKRPAPGVFFCFSFSSSPPPSQNAVCKIV